jgi:regulator of replication initiation timing
MSSENIGKGNDDWIISQLAAIALSRRDSEEDDEHDVAGAAGGDKDCDCLSCQRKHRRFLKAKRTVPPPAKVDVATFEADVIKPMQEIVSYEFIDANGNLSPHMVITLFVCVFKGYETVVHVGLTWNPWEVMKMHIKWGEMELVQSWEDIVVGKTEDVGRMIKEITSDMVIVMENKPYWYAKFDDVVSRIRMKMAMKSDDERLKFQHTPIERERLVSGQYVNYLSGVMVEQRGVLESPILKRMGLNRVSDFPELMKAVQEVLNDVKEAKKGEMKKNEALMKENEELRGQVEELTRTNAKLSKKSPKPQKQVTVSMNYGRTLGKKFKFEQVMRMMYNTRLKQNGGCLMDSGVHAVFRDSGEMQKAVDIIRAQVLKSFERRVGDSMEYVYPEGEVSDSFYMRDFHLVQKKVRKYFGWYPYDHVDADAFEDVD